MKKLISIILSLAVLLLCLPVVSFASETAEPVDLFTQPGVTFSASGYAYYPGGSTYNMSYSAFVKSFIDVNTYDDPRIEDLKTGSWYQANLPAPCRITEVTITSKSIKDYSTASKLLLSKNGDFSDTANGNTVDLGSFNVAAANTDYTITVPQEYANEEYRYIRIAREYPTGNVFGFKDISAKGYWTEPDLSAPEGVEATDLTKLSGVVADCSATMYYTPANVIDGNTNTFFYAKNTDSPEGGAWISVQLPFEAQLSQIKVMARNDSAVDRPLKGFYIEAYNSRNEGTYEVLTYNNDDITQGTTITFDVKTPAKYDHIRIRRDIFALCVTELNVFGYAVAPELEAECNIADGATNVSNPNLTEQVTVTFNQAMDSTTLNGNYVKLTGLYDTVGQYTVSADKKSISFDIKNLCPNKEYTLTVKAGLKNSLGTPLDAATVLAKFTTGKILVDEDCENTTIKNVSVGKTITSPNTFTNIDKIVDGGTGEGSTGSNEFTIDLGIAYAVKAVDFHVHSGWGTEYTSWEIYGHNTETADLNAMTLIDNTLGSTDGTVSGTAKYRVFLNNDTAYRYITLKRSSHHLYEATVWAPVIESLTVKNKYDIPSCDISGSEEEGYQAEIKINNLTGDTTTAPKLIVAVYNGDALVATGVSENTYIANGSNTMNAVISADELSGKTITKAKAFLLTDVNDLTPIVKAVELDLNQQ